jgi:hypothetical protein
MVGLEARVGGDNRWMGFGFSAANATGVLMPGSDAVVGEPPAGASSPPHRPFALPLPAVHSREPPAAALCERNLSSPTWPRSPQPAWWAASASPLTTTCRAGCSARTASGRACALTLRCLGTLPPTKWSCWTAPRWGGAR